MKQFKDINPNLASENKPKPPTSPNTATANNAPSTLSPKAISSIFDMLSSMYGAKADSLMNEQTYQAWARILNVNQITVEHVKYAFRVILSTYPDYPPTLGQFVNACLIKKNAEKLEQEKINKAKSFRNGKPNESNMQARNKAMEQIRKLEGFGRCGQKDYSKE